MKPHPIQLSRLAAAGVNLHVAQAGQGSAVLLLHGFPDHWRLWQPMMQALAPRHRVMAPDLRGINLSDKPAQVADYAIDQLVEDVVALIGHLTADQVGDQGGDRGRRCALVGHDWGGMLAWVVAARHPALVSRLIVFNAPHPCRLAQQLQHSAAQRAASDYVRRLCEPGADAALAADGCARLWAVRSAGRCGPALDAERAHCVQAWSQPGALNAALNWYRAGNFAAALAPPGVAAVPDLADASGVVLSPTLVVWGERDGSFPVQCLDGLAQWVPRLRVHREAQGGHWLLDEQPELAAALVGEFLAESA